MLKMLWVLSLVWFLEWSFTCCHGLSRAVTCWKSLGKSVAEIFVEGSLQIWCHASCTLAPSYMENFLLLKSDSSNSLLRLLLLLLFLLLPPALGHSALRLTLVPLGLLHVSVGDQPVLDGVDFVLVFVLYLHLCCLLWSPQGDKTWGPRDYSLFIPFSSSEAFTFCNQPIEFCLSHSLTTMRGALKLLPGQYIVK